MITNKEYKSLILELLKINKTEMCSEGIEESTSNTSLCEANLHCFLGLVVIHLMVSDLNGAFLGCFLAKASYCGGSRIINSNVEAF